MTTDDSEQRNPSLVVASGRLDQSHSHDSADTDRSKAHVIFDLIKERAWDEVIRYLKESPQAAYCRKRTPHSVQCNLPLHEACRHEPPLTVINSLLERNEDAVHTPGQHGFLPLHIACGTGASYDVVVRLLDAYPAATRCRDDVKDVLPLHLAAQWGASEEVLMEMLTTHPEGSFIRDASGKSPLDHARALPEGKAKQYAITALETAPILVATAKSAARRVEREMELRLRGVQDAHKEFIRQLEKRHEDEKTEFLELEVAFHNELAAEKERNCELAEIIINLQKRELHDTHYCDSLKKELEEVREDSQRRWDQQQRELEELLSFSSAEQYSVETTERKEGEKKQEVSTESDNVLRNTMMSSNDADIASQSEAVIKVSRLVSNYQLAMAELEKTSKELGCKDDMVHHLNDLLRNNACEIESLNLKLQEAETLTMTTKEQLRKSEIAHEGALQELNSAKNEMNRLRRRSETQRQELYQSREKLRAQKSQMEKIKNLVAALSLNVESWSLDSSQSNIGKIEKTASADGRLEKRRIGHSAMDATDRSSSPSESAQDSIDDMENIRHISHITFDQSESASSWNDINIREEEMLMSGVEDEDDENVGLEVSVIKTREESDRSISGSHDTAMTTEAPDDEVASLDRF